MLGRKVCLSITLSVQSYSVTVGGVEIRAWSVQESCKIFNDSRFGPFIFCCVCVMRMQKGSHDTPPART